MCGFIGIWSPREPPNRDTLLRLGDTLAHRGPDDSGIYIDQDAGIGLVHRRLAILDLSPLGKQPMHSRSGRYVIAYNGEIYNHLDLRKELCHTFSETVFRGRSDTETLLAAIEQWGIEHTLEKINGMFAFALWDRRERRLFIARDRMGEKPLYVGWLDGALVCASELKPILSGFSAEMDDVAAGLMLGLGYVPAPYSILRNVFKLPPAHYLGLTTDEVQGTFGLEEFSAASRCYWDSMGPACPAREQASDEERLERLDSLLKDAVRSRMFSDVPLGACLSGGIDSSLIVATMQALSDKAIKTYTVGFEEVAYDESLHARRIAEHLGTDHTQIMLPASAALDLIPRLPRIWDEPFSDSSQVPTLLLSQVIRRHVTVALSGDGGDESFYGYTRYRLARRLWPLYGRLPLGLRRFIAKNTARALQKSFHVWRLSHRLSMPDFDAFYLSFLSPLPDPGLFWNDAPDLWETLPPLPPSITDPDDRMMLRDQMLYLPDDILVKVDRASMAVGLEMRAPLLDHRLIEFARSLPVKEAKYRNGQSKWLLKQLLGRYLPRTLFQRPKQGFGIPIHDWLRGPLREWADDLLSPASLATCPRLRASTIRKIWEAHCARKIDAGYPLWSVLMLMAWMKEWRM